MADKAIHRAENVGSLLRPQWLKDARAQLAAGEISVADFKRIEDRAVDEAVRLYEEVGLDVVTDGEQRRSFFFSTLTEIVDGLGFVGHDAATGDVLARGRGVPVGGRQLPPSGRGDRADAPGALARDRGVRVRARAHPQAPLKVTLPSPLCLVALWSAEHSRDAYPDPLDVVEDVAERSSPPRCASSCASAAPTCRSTPRRSARSSTRRCARGTRSAVGVDPDRMLTEGIDLVNELAKSDS